MTQDRNEAETRAELIDPAIKASGWGVAEGSRVRREVIAIGRQHGLTLQVFGETGGLRWAQEQPNQLYYMPLNGRQQVIERGEANLSPEADRSSRVTIGHAEGMPVVGILQLHAVAPGRLDLLAREVGHGVLTRGSPATVV